MENEEKKLEIRGFGTLFAGLTDCLVTAAAGFTSNSIEDPFVSEAKDFEEVDDLEAGRG